MPLFAQSADSLRLATVKGRLDAVAIVEPAYLKDIDLSVGKIALPELLRNVAKIGGVNLSVKAGDQMMVSCNFTRARIVDLLYFLCKEYDLDVEVIGNIVSVRTHTPLPPAAVDPTVVYDSVNQRMSYDFIDAKLLDVAKKIGSISGSNLIIPQQLYNQKVSGYVADMPLAEAIHTFASVNQLVASEDGNRTWRISPFLATDQGQSSAPQYVRRRQFGQNQLSIDSLGMITANIANGNVYDIILDVCETLKVNYFFISAVNQSTSVFVTDVDLETLFNVLFTGTEYSYYEEAGIYMFGASSADKTLISTRVIPLKYRTVSKVEEVIPAGLKVGVQSMMFADLNSMIVSGDQRQVARVEQFLKSIDKTVPLITIEIMIADITKSNIQEAGISMGVADSPVRSSGTISPGVDVTLGGATLNKMINSFNSFGIVNLGKVSQEFYLGLKFLEETGNIQMKSTPKLSTLNGHEATLKSGETRYYKEVNNSFMGTQNPVQSTAYTWKPIDADLSIKITPYVGQNDEVTLEIEINQSEFTSREEKEAPPGTYSRNFKSIIRLKNEEVVLLGGIERNSYDKSSRGLPFVARVPVLKWLFGSSKNNRVDQRLNVFIKPTIIY